MQRSVFILVLCLLLAENVKSHSWLACSDYSHESDRQWDNTHCRAYPRLARETCKSSGSNLLEDFGKECNLDGTSSGCGKQRTSPVSAGYNTAYPMATYYQGQRVCLAWPAKNHVADACGDSGQYMPDGGLTLYYSQVNPTADPTQTQFEQNAITPFGNGVHTNGVIDYKGFQNCSRFCENKANAFCSGCFNLPANFPVGMYVFQWGWTFNGGQSYKTCFDAEVKSSTASGPTPTPPPAGTPPPAVTPPPAGTPPPPAGTPPTPSGNACPTVEDCLALCGTQSVKTCSCVDSSPVIECAETANVGMTVMVSMVLVVFMVIFNL